MHFKKTGSQKAPNVAVRFDPDVDDTLRQIAEEEGTTVSEVVRTLVNAGLYEYNREKALEAEVGNAGN